MGRKSKYEERQGSLFPPKETNKEEKKDITSHNLGFSAHVGNSSSISQGIQNNTDPIILYPFNWLYNASVIGFLKVIASNGWENEIEKKWLKDNGTVEIPRDGEIFKNWFDWYKEYHGGRPPLYGKNNLYPNYINPGKEKRIEDENSLKEWVEKLIHTKEINKKYCGLCLRNFDINSNILTQKAKKYVKSKTENFISSHTAFLAPAITKFPNALWNLNHSLYICPLCAYLIIHHHIPFQNTKIGNHEIFINANSFKVMWYLNKFAENVLNKKNEKSIRRILGLSLIEFSQRIYATLGVWSMASIEVVIKKDEHIDYYSLPYDIISILLNSEVSKLISEINEPVVLDKILAGDFDYLLTIAHYLIRDLYSKGNNKNNKNNPILESLKISKNANRKKLAYKLPELYGKINSIIRGGTR